MDIELSEDSFRALSHYFRLSQDVKIKSRNNESSETFRGDFNNRIYKN